MIPKAVQRKLAALLSADVVGYSRLIAQDEVATLETLNAHRNAMGGLIRQHGGRVVDAVGDNLLSEFASVVDSVACAVAIQRELATRNADVPDERKMQFRIGIHLGDVVVLGERIAGDGVNIAARLQALAEPGGICISANIYDQVRGKLSEQYEDLGEQALKNIAYPIRAYRVRLADAEKQDSAAALTVPGFAGRPAIAVLAFDNLSADSEQEYFADGIAEELITRLSAWRWFPVIARNSSFTYKGKAVDVKQVSRELGVRYVVEGSVRKSGDRVRISAKLIDATLGHHIWSERYDRELHDVFALQDELAQAIVEAIEPKIRGYEPERAIRRDPRNLNAWESAQRAVWHINQLTRGDNAKARALCERATELDPHLVLAFCFLTVTHYCDALFRWTDSPDRSVSEAMRAAQRSAVLDDEDPFGQLALGLASSLTGDQEKTIGAVDRAVQLNPSFATAHYVLGGFLALAGRPDEGIAELEKAIRLSPHDPWMWDMLCSMALAHFAAGRYEAAVEWARKSIRWKPDYPVAHSILAVALAQLGRIDEARATLSDSEKVKGPKASLAAFDLARLAGTPDFNERFLDGLRKAGWRKEE